METTNSVSEEWCLAEANSRKIYFKRFIVVPKKELMSTWAYRPIATGTREEMEALQKLTNAAHGNN